MVVVSAVITSLFVLSSFLCHQLSTTMSLASGWTETYIPVPYTPVAFQSWASGGTLQPRNGSLVTHTTQDLFRDRLGEGGGQGRRGVGKRQGTLGIGLT